MAKARMVRSEIRTSTVVAEWPLEARYFWILLWGYVDDYGRGKDNVKLIKADCFPLDDSVTTEMVDEWLWLFAEAGVIVRYTVEGCDFLAVKNWAEHQKVPHPGKDNFPDFTGQNVQLRDFHEGFMNVSEQAHDTFTVKLSKDKLSEVVTPSGDDRHSKYSDDFESWWSMYPRKVAKGDAWKAWEKLAKNRELPAVDVLIAKAEAYGRVQTDIKFVKHPATWLNSLGWLDELNPVSYQRDDDWMIAQQIVVS
jgi:hypothetical protein